MQAYVTRHLQRRNTDAVDQQLQVYLHDSARYPGDLLRGMVQVHFPAPAKLKYIDIEIRGEESAELGTIPGLLNAERRHTVYYLQYISILGKGSEALLRRRRRRLVVGECGMYRTLTDHAETVAELTSPVSGSLSSDVESLTKPVLIDGDVISMQSGTYTFPFSVTLPDVLPPSFAISRRHGNSCKLKYTIHVQMRCEKTAKPSMKASVGFTVLPLPVQLQHWLHLHWASGAFRKAGFIANEQNDDINSRNEVSCDKDEADTVSQREAINHELSFREAQPTSEDAHVVANQENPLLSLSSPPPLQAPRSCRMSSETPPEEVLIDVGNGTLNTNNTARVPVVTAEMHDDQSSSATHTEHEEDAQQGERQETAADSTDAQSPAAPAGESPMAEAYIHAPTEEEIEALLPEDAFEYTFSMPLRSGPLSKRDVLVRVILRNIVLVSGRSRVQLRAVVDNTVGGTMISKVKFSLITRQVICSRVEKLSFSDTLAEVTVQERIPKGKVASVSPVELVVPSHTPLTLMTAGFQNRTFMNVRIYSANTFKTSRSAECELLIVNAVDISNQSHRLQRWTVSYKHLALSKHECSAEPLDLHGANLSPSAVDPKDEIANDEASTSSFRGASLNMGTHGVTTPTVSHPTSGMNRDNLKLRVVHNFTEATYKPSEDIHADPMASWNPLTQQL